MRAIVRLYRGQNNYDFVRIWRWTLRVAVGLVVVSIVAVGLRGLNLGIDFEGGVSWQLKAPGATVEQTRAVLGPLGLGEAKVQTIGREVIRVQASADSAQKKTEVQHALAQMAGTADTDVNVSDVGPTWGSSVTAGAVRALLVFLLAIVVYVTATFRGEWKMAIGVVLAVIHDVVISVGVYAIFQFEVTPATVIAFLTILGYSIYDTVVVYDKVQENAGKVGVSQRLTYTGMMNLSMNQVLLRSINTSMVGVLPVLSTLIVGAMILGAVTLEEFAIALTVGLFIGAYSSIFVAAPVVALLKEREPRYRQLRERLERAGSDGATGGVGVKATAAGVSTADPTAPVDEAQNGAVPVGAGAPAGRPAGEGAATLSGNIPPRPRKKGKRR
jgi:preprotein translocase subunit SecF